MKEEEYLKEYFKQLKSEKLEKAKRLVNLARQEEREKYKIGLQKIFEAEKKWILSSGHDLDAPCVALAEYDRVITLRDMLNDIEEGNDRAIKQAQSLINLTCEMLIKPYSLADKIKEKEHQKAIEAYRNVTCKMGIDIPCERCSDSCKIYKFKELLNK